MVEPGRAALVDVGVPEPGPGQVRLDVLAVGICHSDLHVVDHGAGAAWALPFTLGHEICGRVAALGAGVEGPAVGAQVVVHAPVGCGRCPRCVQGRTNYCDERRTLPAAGVGLGVDGGMAAALVVGQERLVAADGLDPALAATLTDAGLTSFHAVEGCRDALAAAGSVAVVIGVGGLGHLAIGILRAAGASRIVAVDTREEALDLGRWAGADVAVAPAGAEAAVRGASGGRGADAVLDFAAVQSSLDLVAVLLRTAGELVVVGSGGGVLPVTKPGPLPSGAGIRLPFWGSRKELVEVVELARAGAVRARTRTFGLGEAEEAFDELRRGAIVGRAVLVPDRA
ncbi:alcohol dehydrogenase catalytic domain-containing protein [Pseudonocardia broussonetiae]|uniref:alcohol dehydrogenase n=2 Tax=Pseudonocardia broussonetiae TaxID=2736640 RepID=A0A6M6JX04_9PSEU|nr:alcohol dehydrogenase catalytic domain-containing protein [Pseudonocardia broussonetiae]